MSSNGSILGAKNTPTAQVASGTWGTNELMYYLQQNSWPTGNLKIEVGSFVSSAATGTQDITITTDGTGLAAGTWAVIFWTTYSRGASAVWDVLPVAGIGYVANGGGTISQYAIGTAGTDGAAISDTQRRMAAACITVPHPNSGSPDEAVFVGFQTATTMRINWTARNYSGSNRINYTIISGLSGAKVVQWSLPASATNKSVTGVGFSPDHVFHAHTFMTSTPQSLATNYFSLGMMNKHGQQGANSVHAQDNVNPSNTTRAQRTDSCLLGLDDLGGYYIKAHFASMDADGFTVNFSTMGLDASYDIISLCLDGVSSKIGAFTKDSTTPTVTQVIDSRQGFVPKALLLTSLGVAANASPSSAATWALGMSDGINHRSVTLTDIDAVSPTQSDSVWHSDKSLVIHYSAGVSGAAAGAPTLANTTFSLPWTNNDGFSQEVIYCLLSDGGTDTFPASITRPGDGITSTSTAYSNQKKVTELSDGTLVAQAGVHASLGAFFFYSKDSGKTWTYMSGIDIAGWSNGSIDSYVDSGGTERLVAVWKQTGTGGGRTDGYIYLMIGTFSSSNTVLTWGAAVAIPGWGGGYEPFINYPDLVAHAEGGITGGQVHIAFSYLHTGVSQNYPVMNTVPITGTTIGSFTQTSPGGSVTTATIHPFPSIDYDPATKRLFMAWSAGTTGAGKGIRFRTAAYSAGAWTWATEREVSPNHYIYSTDNLNSLQCRWDGTAVIIGGYMTGGTAIWESTDYYATAPTVLRNTSLGLGAATSITISAATRDIYVFGSVYSGASYVSVGYAKYTRSSSSWGSLVQTDYAFSPGGGSTVHNVSSLPLASGVGWIYTAGNGLYGVKYDRIQ